MQIKFHGNFKNTILVSICLLSGLLVSCKDDVSLNSPNGLVVILKADDMGDVGGNWNRFIQILVDDSICAGIGVISKNVHESSIPEIQKIANIKQKNGYPVVEFWNHGYDHIDLKPNSEITEFYNTDYNYQRTHFRLAQHFFSDTLHITSHSFGAPHNRTKLITEGIIESFPEINVWQHYGKIEQYTHTGWKDPKLRVIQETDKRIILSIDYLSLKSFNVESFEKNYINDNKKPYIIIQIHPATWNEEIFVKFENLIQFYKQSEHHATFMTPYQYYESMHKKLIAN